MVSIFRCKVLKEANFSERRKTAENCVRSSKKTMSRLESGEKILLTLILFTCIPAAWCLDCFKCVSVGASNPSCDEPFHNNYTSDILETPCMGGRKDRNGLFPATACLKLSGVYQNGTKMVVRGCGLDSGSLTVDTEIVRMSHCGGFYFDNDYVSGCLTSCTDDACNFGIHIVPDRRSLLLLSCLVIATLFVVDITSFCRK